MKGNVLIHKQLTETSNKE